jgi:propanediol dehydratase large subunit
MRPSTIRRLWRVVRATPAQQVAVDAVLGGPVAVPPAKPATAHGARFDEVERVLSLALDALLNAVDSYRGRKKGGSL